MAVEAKKKKNCYSANFNNDQNRKIRSKVSDNSEKREDRGKKRMYSTESQNGKMELAKNQTNESTYVKSSVSNSVINTVDRAIGHTRAFSVSKFHKEVVINNIKRFQLSQILCPFNRRVTAISWHPKFPQIFVAGSKGGDLLLHNLNDTGDYLIPGVGAGGSILGLMCSEDDPYSVYTASLIGKICWVNLHERKSEVIFSLPLRWDNWFTSLDICRSRKFILSGDCRGNAYLLSTDGKLIWQPKKLHSSKVTHCEFNKHDPNIFVTSSNDRTVKLWDLRTVSNSAAKREEPLATFQHEKALNSAYFSPSNGINILTTDQHSELRIYSGPLWDEMIKIIHPHRQFQHMTQMKATWHPLEDIVIVGRYPDDNIQTNDSRTIDFYDGLNGQLLHKILSPTHNIVSLNAMNSTGEVLAAAAGFGMTILKDGQVLKEERSEAETDECTETTTSNMNKRKKKNDANKVKKSVCTKKKVL